jgi:hypothetical protein
MKKITVFFFALFLLSATSEAQVSSPKLKKFNVGLFMGLGGETGPFLDPIPVLNVSYKGTSLTTGVAPNGGFTVGLIQDIKPISVAFYNVRWIASGFYSTGKSDRYFSRDAVYNSAALLTGLRFYFAQRFYSNAQLGASYTSYKTQGFEDVDEWLPFFEFGIGVQLFKTFEPKKKPASTVSE